MVCEKGGLKDVMELLGRCGGEAQSGFGGGKSRVSLIKAALQVIFENYVFVLNKY